MTLPRKVNLEEQLGLSLPFINPEDIFKRLGERIHGGARQHA